MRRLLLVFLMCVLPLQGFAAVLVASKTAVSALQIGAVPCHQHNAHQTPVTQIVSAKAVAVVPDTSFQKKDACSAYCHAMCGICTGLVPLIATPKVVLTTQSKPLGLLITYMSAAIAQPTKPPIF
jgi:hypothetical protein